MSKKCFNRMKYEIAKEVGVPLDEEYNGDITTREAGKIGGGIVQRVFEEYEDQNGSQSDNWTTHK